MSTWSHVTMGQGIYQRSLLHNRTDGGRVLQYRTYTTTATTIVRPSATTQQQNGPLSGSQSPVWDDTLLRDSTAIVRSGDSVAYILGISHVSKESCRLIEELIEEVGPDAVMVELCHERTGLLVDESAAKTGKNAWFSASVDIQGLPQEEYWPKKADLLGLLRTSRGYPVSTLGIQADADALLATGLFESVTPVTGPPPQSWDPMFVYIRESDEVIPGVELSSITFKVTPRRLPPVDSLKVVFENGNADEQISSSMHDIIMNKNSSTSRSTLDVLLRARHECLSNGIVTYEWQDDTGMHVTARVLQDQSHGIISGLENTVYRGKGIGITSFSRRFMGPNEDATTSPDGATAELVEVSPWDIHMNDRPRDTKEGQPSTTQGFLESYANAVTMQYAKYQADAGRKVGIVPGHAWRVALAAAARSRVPYVFLGDRLSSVTSQRLLQGMVISSLPYLATSAAISLASWVAPPLLLHATPSLPASAVITAASFLAAVWPLYSPIQEIQKFSEMSASQIEDAVRVTEPLQSASTAPFYLWGEDALIRWPGAEKPVIHDRDRYMAYAVYSILKNIPSGLTPTYAATSEEHHGTVYSYAMPKGSSPTICPPGKGQGQYSMSSPQKVVAIVGTAHVRGMQATLVNLLSNPSSDADNVLDDLSTLPS